MKYGLFDIEKVEYAQHTAKHAPSWSEFDFSVPISHDFYPPDIDEYPFDLMWCEGDNWYAQRVTYADSSEKRVSILVNRTPFRPPTLDELDTDYKWVYVANGSSLLTGKIIECAWVFILAGQAPNKDRLQANVMNFAKKIMTNITLHRTDKAHTHRALQDEIFTLIDVRTTSQHISSDVVSTWLRQNALRIEAITNVEYNADNVEYMRDILKFFEFELCKAQWDYSEGFVVRSMFSAIPTLEYWEFDDKSEQRYFDDLYRQCETNGGILFFRNMESDILATILGQSVPEIDLKLKAHGWELLQIGNCNGDTAYDIVPIDIDYFIYFDGANRGNFKQSILAKIDHRWN